MNTFCTPKLAIVIAFLLLPLCANAVQPDEMLHDTALESRAREISKDLRCLVCQNESIDDSNAPLAHDLRVLLRERLTAGDSDDAAKQYIVDRYGDYVLLTPPFKITTWVLWLSPVILLFVGGVSMRRFYRSSKKIAKDSDDVSYGNDVAEEQLTRTERPILTACAFFIFVGAIALYICLGAPNLPDKPYASRQNDPDFRLNTAAEKIAKELEQHPDADGYKRVTGMFYALRRYDRAADAAHHATDINPKDSEAWSMFGESLTMQNDGAVPMEAVLAFKSALTHNHDDQRARFYMGLAQTEIGNLKKAVAIWRDLEQSAPADAPWLPIVKRNIDYFSKQGGFDPESVTPHSP
jgi:cytochrome c-type biogenesis protein CcmH